ncbi:MAG: hypothetical protein N4J56_007578 [Chroococcidiopsis sp. SAG 2025]|uniref:hypothetical protein n=1 Tax=Chroococcidiopsis sp. SAG 2025 TaxID=171389 RepID=UPI002936E0B3|nr:hypothetical protein [Chroococcidiopsis sp. SAG 2025]MDV2997873.1 hypothetical protein [Chroococcidiopsis sp. SAG 2025]
MKAQRVKGKFYTEDEPIASKITFRVPASLRKAAEDSANGDLAEWLRQAIAEKLEREQQATV